MTEQHPYMEAMESIQKMIDSEFMDLYEGDDGQPRLLMSSTLYDAFFFSDFLDMNDDVRWWQKIFIYHLFTMRWILSCVLWGKLRTKMDDKIGDTLRKFYHKFHWFDEKKALAFLDKVRFVINFRRGYVAGLRNYGQDDIEPKKEEEMLRKLYLADTEWITFYVLTQDLKPIIIGRWKSDKFEVRKWEDKDTIDKQDNE